jgi:predicted GNAT family acetyltransferase
MTTAADPASDAPPPAGRRVERRSDRYELRDGDELLSFADFSEADDVVTIPHVETVLHHRGNGYSTVLMAGVVDDLRARHVRIEPICPVARAYVERQPDADALLVD